jgi:hypothetical protein
MRPSIGRGRLGIVHTSLYLPEAVHEALREAAFEERRKIHDLILEGIELALRKRGNPSIADLKAKYERKGR